MRVHGEGIREHLVAGDDVRVEQHDGWFLVSGELETTGRKEKERTGKGERDNEKEGDKERGTYSWYPTATNGTRKHVLTVPTYLAANDFLFA